MSVTLPNDPQSLGPFKVEINPNPGYGKFTITPSEPGGTLVIYDQYGKLLLEKKIVATEIIDISHASFGIYYYIYRTESNKQTGKIIIH